MAIKYSLTNCTQHASQCKPKLPIVAKKEADAFKNLQWKTKVYVNGLPFNSLLQSFSIFKWQQYATSTINIVIFS